MAAVDSARDGAIASADWLCVVCHRVTLVGIDNHRMNARCAWMSGRGGGVIQARNIRNNAGRMPRQYVESIMA